MSLRDMGKCTCTLLDPKRSINQKSSIHFQMKIFWVSILLVTVLVDQAFSWRTDDLDLYRDKRGRQQDFDDYETSNGYDSSNDRQPSAASHHHHRSRISSSFRRDYRTCIQSGEYLRGFTLEGGTKAGNFTRLGDADTLNECASMCCMRKSCQQALLLTQPDTGYKTCFQVICTKSSSCKAISDRDSNYNPQLFRKGSASSNKKVATSEVDSHSIISNEGKGFCRQISGHACANYVDPNAMYYFTSNKNNTDLDKRLQKPIKLISSRLTGKCKTIALQAICYRFYPQCSKLSSTPKSINVCEDECTEILAGDCSDAFEIAHLSKYLQKVIPKCAESNTYSGEDDDEDQENGNSDAQCTHLQEVLPKAINHPIRAVPTTSSSTTIPFKTNPTNSVKHTTLKPSQSQSFTGRSQNATKQHIYNPTRGFTSRKPITTPTVDNNDVDDRSDNRNSSLPTYVNITSGEDQGTGFEQMSVKKAVKDPRNTKSTNLTVTTTENLILTTPPPTVKVSGSTEGESDELRVSAGDDSILTLPENKITLYASAWPKEKKEGDYKYKWSQISAPTNSHGEIEGKNTKSVKLTKLGLPGLYTFKLEVTSTVDSKHGVGFVNITVKEAARKNKPPRAEVFPKDQTIMLPTNTIILDASKSSDDDKIVSYKWEELKGPIKENTIFTSSDKKILELKNLVAGVYKFKLTVTDSNGETDSTEARVNVKKEQDYPPEANAGNDVVIRLPNNSVILDGSRSKDDKGKLLYAWRKTPESPICDLTGSSQAKLKVSRMVVGTYAFVLKVTDSSGQANEAQVKVVVLPEENTVPVAKAGDDKEIVYPDDSTTLDGSKSTDNSKITSYLWQKISGPDKIKIVGATNAKVHLTDLVPGTYVIKLTVTDDKKLTGSDTVKIHVKKNHNDPPIAVAGQDHVVYLPSRTVSIDGSKSHDDGLIDAFKWTRAGLSPAAGTVVNASDQQAVLQLTDLVKGQYTFQLTVTDDKGLTGSDEVSVYVKENPFSSNLVEMYLGIDINKFTEEDKKQLLRKISVLLEVGSEFVFVQGISDLGFKKGVKLIFYVKDPNFEDRRFDGKFVADTLKQKVGNGGKLFDITMLRVEPYVCRKKCSGHGYCDHVSKKCVCDAFWTANFFKAHLGDKESNCDWSILYMSVVIFGAFLLLIGLSWTICFCVARKKRNVRRARYRALRSTDPDGAEDEMLMIPKDKFTANSLTFSDTDDESDDTTVFDKKQRHRNGGLSNSKLQKYMDRAF